MPLVIPVGFAQCAHHFTGGAAGELSVTTYGVDLQGYPDTPAEAATDLYTIFQTHIASVILAGAMQHVKTVLKLGPVSTGATYEHAGEGQTDNGASSPPNVAFLMKKNTALGGRRGRGRMYLPGVAENAVDNAGNLTSGQVVTNNVQLSAWLGALNGANLPMVLFHDTLSVPPTDVVNMSASPKIATQRRRVRR